MTRHTHTEHLPKLSLAEIIERVAGGRLAIRVKAYDGSSAGPDDAPYGLELLTPRGTTYLAIRNGERANHS